MHAYVKLGMMPEAQVTTRFPDRLAAVKDGFYKHGEPVLKAEEIARLCAADAKVERVASATVNPDWRGEEVLMCRNGTLTFELDVPADGPYSLVLGHTAEAGGVGTVTLNGKSLPLPVTTVKAWTPEQTVFPPVTLKAGKARVTVSRDGAFGLYGVKWLPSWRPMPSAVWATTGPFKSFWRGGLEPWYSGISKGFETVYPPETNRSLSAVYDVPAELVSRDQRRLGWSFDDDGSPDVRLGPLDMDHGKVRIKIGVNFKARTGAPANDFSFATMFTENAFVGNDRIADRMGFERACGKVAVGADIAGLGDVGRVDELRDALDDDFHPGGTDLTVVEAGFAVTTQGEGVGAGDERRTEALQEIGLKEIAGRTHRSVGSASSVLGNHLDVLGVWEEAGGGRLK